MIRTLLVAVILVTPWIAVAGDATTSKQSYTYSPGQEAALEAATTLNKFISENKYTEGAEFGLDAYNQALAKLGENDITIVNLGLALSTVLGEIGAWDNAHEVAGECLVRLEKRHGTDHIYLVPSLVTLGIAQSSKGRLASFNRALTLQKKHKPDDKLAYAEVAKIAGRYLSYQRENRKEGIKLLREALDLYKAEHGDQSVEIIQPLMWLGEAQIEKNSFRASKRLFDRAINIARKSGDRYLYADQLYVAGSQLLNYSFSSETGKYLKKAHQEFNELLGPDSLETAKAQLLLSEFYLRSGKVKKAEPGLLAALSVLEDQPNYRTAKLSALSLLVETYELKGQSDKATPYCKAIGEIQPWHENQEVSPIYKRRVKYPPTAAQNGYRGYVITEFSVDENGFVQSPVVVDSRGPKAFEREALRAISGYRYAPRFVDGKPVVTPKITNKIIFKMDRKPRSP